MENKKRIFLVDGYGFIFRAFHSLPPLTRKDGLPVGAVYGFINMMTKLLKMVEDHSYQNYLALVFDSGRETFRNKLYSEYKANRPEAPEELKKQFPIMREVADALNIKALEQVGYEADDLIATYAKIASRENSEVIIVSSDKDLMQLVNDKVKMFDPLKNVNIGRDEVIKKFGVPPEKVIDMQAMIGDSSDNIPGIPGIGPKTALELITEFGSLDAVLENASKIKQKKRSEVVQNNKEMALLSRKLVTLDSDVPVTTEFSELEVKKIDYQKFIEFLKKYEFHSLLSKIEGISKEAAPRVLEDRKPTNSEIKKFETEEALESFIKEIRPEKNCFIYYIPEKKEVKEKILIGFNLGDKHSICYFDITEKTEASADLFAENKPVGILLSSNILKKMFESPYIKKIFFEAKPLIRKLQNNNINIEAFDCLITLSSILDSSRIKQEFSSISENAGCSQILAEESEENFIKIIENLSIIHNSLSSRLVSEKKFEIYEKTEKPLSVVLAKIENNGVKVDEKILISLSKEFAEKIAILEKEVFKQAGQEFNIGSPKQISEVLFERMGFDGGKKGKTGSYSTGADVLEKLAAGGQKIAADILEWRQISKLKSTYTDALQKEINRETKRIHTTFSTAITATGRLSSHDPNLQNIPIRTEEGRKIRSAFIAEPGNKLISADYSQIELRLLAHAADIKSLKDAFLHGEDIHKITAHQVFGVPLDSVTPDLRRAAKTINFGIIYGQTAYGLSEQLGIGVGEADKYIKSYFEKYPGIKEYMEKYKEFAKHNGYVETFLGRKCYINGINDKNFAIRSFAERAAINYPLQGTAADIIKKAMVNLQNLFENKALKSKITLQVHDELLIEAPENEAENIQKYIKKTMENSASLSVPIVVDVKAGNNWGEVH